MLEDAGLSPPEPGNAKNPENPPRYNTDLMEETPDEDETVKSSTQRENKKKIASSPPETEKRENKRKSHRRDG